METFTTHPVALAHLLSSIHVRDLALPDFQRDFVWDARATEELIESIARSFPAGSLLFMPWRKDTFSPRAIEAAPPLDGARPKSLILDGQQRLSSLYQACYGVGDYRYFVDLQALCKSADVEDAIFYRHRSRSGAYATLDQQARELVLPIGVLFGSGGGFHAVFDLLAARFYAHGLDLRRKWAETTDRLGIIDEFAIDRYYVLQSIALLARGSVKRGDVLELSVGDIETHWDPVMESCRAALEMLRDECGVKVGKWLPYGYLLVPMAAVWREHVEAPGPSAGANRSRLKRWFWCSGLSGSYDRAANSQAAKDFNELRRWFAGGPAPDTVTQFSFDAARLREITPKQQSVYRALMALIMRHGAADFHSGHALTPAAIAAQRVDDHHVFPRGYLAQHEDARYPSQLVDRILNRTLIDASTNQRIGKRSPGEYLAEIRAELEGTGTDGSFDDLLDSHLLPAGSSSPLLRDDFKAFLDWREARIAAEIGRLTERQVSSVAGSSA